MALKQNGEKVAGERKVGAGGGGGLAHGARELATLVLSLHFYLSEVQQIVCSELQPAFLFFRGITDSLQLALD